MKDLADVHFANAKTIVLVQDNLNIHAKASLYEAFEAAQARRLVERFEWHYTPKHGSWLDLAESELGVLSPQCLDRRIPDKQTLVEEIAACIHPRGAKGDMFHAQAFASAGLALGVGLLTSDTPSGEPVAAVSSLVLFGDIHLGAKSDRETVYPGALCWISIWREMVSVRCRLHESERKEL